MHIDPATHEHGASAKVYTYEADYDIGPDAIGWTASLSEGGTALEPIAARYLIYDRDQSPNTEFERGRQLAAALHCAACHRDEAASVTPAPALDRLSGNVHEAWLVEWLQSHAADAKQPLRRMPDFSLLKDEATAIAAWLLREPAVKVEVKLPDERAAKAKSKSGKARLTASRRRTSRRSRGRLNCSAWFRSWAFACCS